MNEIIDNRYIKYMTFIVIPLSVLADFMSKSEYFLGVLLVILIFSILAIFDNKKMKKLYSSSTVPIPIVVNIDSSESSKYVLNNLFQEIEKGSKFKNLKENLKQYRDIVEEDLVFDYKGDLYDKNRLISFMQIIKYQITKIKENTPSKVQFHVAYYKRPAYSFSVGYIFAEEDVVIYQQNPDKDTFDKVAELKDRNYKNEVDEYQKFNIETLKEDSSSETVLLGIKASSHYISFNSTSLSQYTNVVSMTAFHKGTIEVDEDWELYAREVFTVLQQLRQKYKNITIAHNMPESIAFILGMAIGNYWNIQMTQFNSGEYIETIKLDEVKCYF